jgi:predicted SprT family Zn-dependent metalloprotease
MFRVVEETTFELDEDIPRETLIGSFKVLSRGTYEWAYQCPSCFRTFCKVRGWIVQGNRLTCTHCGHGQWVPTEEG